jgi:hypothetical protein
MDPLAHLAWSLWCALLVTAHAAGLSLLWSLVRRRD